MSSRRNWIEFLVFIILEKMTRGIILVLVMLPMGGEEATTRVMECNPFRRRLWRVRIVLRPRDTLRMSCSLSRMRSRLFIS